MPVTITLSIPDAQANRVVNALSISGSYQTTIDGSPNPQTKARFVKQMLVSYVMDTVKSVEAQSAVDTARTTALANIDSQITIT